MERQNNAQAVIVDPRRGAGNRGWRKRLGPDVDAARSGRRRECAPESAVRAGAAQQPFVPRQAHPAGMRSGHRPPAACRLRRLVWRRGGAPEQAASALRSPSEGTEMSNPAPGFVSRPDYRVALVPESRRVKVVFGGVTIADSSAALRVEETGHAPVYYVP